MEGRRGGHGSSRGQPGAPQSLQGVEVCVYMGVSFSISDTLQPGTFQEFSPLQGSVFTSVQSYPTVSELWRLLSIVTNSTLSKGHVGRVFPFMSL